jgi:hypothetical protein
MSFGGLLSSLLRLHVHTHSLTTLAYFFMQELLFAYQNNVRAAAFVGIGRPPASARGDNRVLLKKALDAVVVTNAMVLCQMEKSQRIPIRTADAIVTRSGDCYSSFLG